MKHPPEDLHKRLLFILHRALTEARLLAQQEKHKQLYDLTDAIESIPAYITRWREEDLQVIRFNLQNYLEKYPDSGRFQYVEFLNKWDVPEF